MQDSMMIAEVGDIEKVSGSRMATPLAPPSPGSTPMITPNRMPTTISSRLNGWMTTANPWNRLAISSISDPNSPAPSPPAALAKLLFRLKPQQFLDRPLRQGNEEPFFEDHIGEGGNADRNRQRQSPAVAAEPFHEHADQQHRGDVEAEPGN